MGDCLVSLFFGSFDVVPVLPRWLKYPGVPIAAFQDKLDWSKNKSVTIIAGGSAVISTDVLAHSAITFVDIIDYFASNIGYCRWRLLSIILLSWFRCPLMKQLEGHVNEFASVKREVRAGTSC